MSRTNDLEMNDLRAHELDHAGDHDNDNDHAQDTRPLLASSHDNESNVYYGRANEKESLLHQLCPAGIASLTVQTQDSKASPKRSLTGKSKTNGPKPARWRTTEFYVYYVLIGLYLLLMIRTTYRLSSGKWSRVGHCTVFYSAVRYYRSQLKLFSTSDSHPNYWIFEKRLSEGWLFGRKVVSFRETSSPAA
jgi:hypothetical protein